MNQPATKTFSLLTEAPGQQATEQQLSMILTRYKLANEYCQDKDVLELACGTGIGLSYLASGAKSIVGGDIDPNNVAIAKNTYQDRPNISVLELDVCDLPFAQETFDTILLFEAIYYVGDMQKCLSEVSRVLRSGGTFIIVTVNREWTGFNASPFSEKYYNCQEIQDLLDSHNFSCKISAAYFDDQSSLSRKMLNVVRKIAVRLNLIPKTMASKELLKRIFYGTLKSIPAEITDSIAEVADLKEINNLAESRDYKVIYAVAIKK
jgi:ubiquinone/menaquinone biosynthesis C-methylase UbiE